MFGISQLPRVKDNLARTILGGQILSIGLAYIRNPEVTLSAMLLFMLTLAMAIYYGSMKKGFSARKRTMIILPASFILIKFVFMIQHYPGANIINILMLIPLLVYAIGVLSDLKNFKYELGFLSIITAEALLAVLRWTEVWWK